MADFDRVRKARPLGIDDCVIGFGHAFPAFVAIHGVIAAADRRDADARKIGDAVQERLHEASCALRRRIAPVEEGVHMNRQALRAQESAPAPRCGPDANARRRATSAPSDAPRPWPLCAASMSARKAGRSASEPSFTASSMRARSCITRRPAPILVWPTSELPIWPSGRPDRAARRGEQRMRAFAHHAFEIGVPRQSDGVVANRSGASPSRRARRAPPDAAGCRRRRRRRKACAILLTP